MDFIQRSGLNFFKLAKKIAVLHQYFVFFSFRSPATSAALSTGMQLEKAFILAQNP